MSSNQSPEVQNEVESPAMPEENGTETTDVATDVSNESTDTDAKPEKSEEKDAKATSAKKKTTTKKSSPKKATKKPSTPTQALHAAVSSGEPQEGIQTFFLPISQIEVNDNPRHEPSVLFDQGYVLIGEHPTWEPEPVEVGEEVEQETRICLRDMAISDDLEVVQEFVELIEEFEVVDRNEEPNAPQSIEELAYDLRHWSSVNKNGHGQWVPAYVKKERGKWVLIDGGRRTTAILYNHAKDRLARANKEEDAPAKPYPAVLLCLDATGVKQDQFFELSMLLNMSRKQMTPLQEGKVYYNLLQTINPDTQKKYNIKDLHKRYGASLNVAYGTMRNRIALWEPYRPAKVDEETGDVKQKARGLTDTDRHKVATGELSATKAARKSLGERHNEPRNPPKKGESRRRSLPLVDIEKEFDKTPNSKKQYKEALAFCMGISLELAEEESQKRLEAAEEADLERAA